MQNLLQKIFLAIFATIIFACFAFILLNPLNIKTDLISLLPKEKNILLQDKAFDNAAKQVSENIIILIGNEHKDKAYEIVNLFYDEIKEIEAAKITYKIDIKENNISDFYSAYKYQLLSSQYIKLLQNDDGQIIRQKALHSLYSPVSTARFIKEDPFLLSYDFLNNLPILQTNLLFYKDILISEYGQKYYALISIRLKTKDVFSVSDLKNSVGSIEKTRKKLQKQFTDSEFVISGVPIHSYYSSSNAQKEIGLIGTIATFGVLLLVYLSFRSFRPLAFSLFSTASGFIIAFTTTHLYFGGIHLITIVFGTSLIGVGVDYSLHFFAQFLDKGNKNDGKRIIKKIFSGITLGLIASILGYASLMIAPFPALQEISLFSIVGLIVSYLATLFILPQFYKAKILPNQPKIFLFSQKLIVFLQNKLSRRNVTIIFLSLAIFSAIGLANIKFNDNIKALYSAPQELINNEILSRKILQQNISSQFFLVTAENQQELLQKEENFRKKLDHLIAKEEISSYQALSQFIPSIKQQSKNKDLIKNRLIIPYFDAQTKDIGLENQQKSEILKLNQNKFLEYEDIKNNPNFFFLENLYLGTIDGQNSSIILLNNVADINLLKDLQEIEEGIFFMDKLQNISDSFSKYRKISLISLSLVYTLIFVLFIIRYQFVNAIFVFLPPLLAATTTLAIIIFLGYSLNLFHILALFLILGIGVDYSIFYAESKDHIATTSFAIMLSCITAILSFGLLALSSFGVVHAFGLVVFFGVIFSFLLATLSLVAKSKST